MAVTRINNNQITDSSAGNIYVGINAGTKLQAYSVTAGKIANNLVYGSDLTVSGNLTVNGQTTTIDSTITTIEDPVIVLASTQTGSPSVDIGFIGERGTSENIAFVWDESAQEFVTVFTSTSETNTTVTITGYANAHVGNMVVGGTTSLSGNVIGAANFTGNVTGGNLLTPGLISATGTITSSANITGGNVLTGGLISATGTITSVTNITGGNLLTGGNVSATGNITGGNIISGNAVIGNINVSGDITVNSLTSNTFVSATGNVVSGNVLTGGLVSATGTVTGSSLLGSVVSASGTITGGNLATGGTVSATGTITGGNLATGGTVSATGNITAGNISAGSGIIDTTGNINGGNLNAATGVRAVTGYFTGNVDVLGNLNASIGVVYANSGIFYGNAVTGNNAAFAGVPGFTPLGSNVVMQFAGNVNSYSQLNFQNINSGNIASTDFILTADNGSDTTYYADFGINSSTFDDPADYPGYGANDSYVHNHGGNLILNPESAGKAINFMVGGTDTTDIIATMTATQLTVDGITSVTGNVTAGNVLTGGLISATGTITSVATITGGNLATGGTASATGNITGGNVLTGGQVSATGNLTGGNVNTNSIVGSGITITSTGTLNLAPTGNITANAKNINNLADPVQEQDAATKIYVDTVAQGLDIKASVVFATAANIAPYTYNNGASGVGATLTAQAVGNLVIDGNVVAAGERVLIKNEVGAFVDNTTQSAAFNGIYVVTTAGSPSVAYVLTRSTDFDNGSPSGEIPGAFTFVEKGATEADTGWVCTTNAPVTVGTTQIIWTQFSGAGSYTAGNGLSLTGTQFNVLTDGNANPTTGINGSNQVVVPAGAAFTTPDIGAATGTSLSATGTITAASTVGGVITGTSASVTGTVTAASTVGGVITGSSASLSGNVNGGNVITGGIVSASGNVYAPRVLNGGSGLTIDAGFPGYIQFFNSNGSTVLIGDSGNISATGNITSAGNIAGGNVLTGGLISATANITGGNILSGGLGSFTGNVTAANFIGNITGNIDAAGANTQVQFNDGDLLGASAGFTFDKTANLLTVTGNVAGGNVLTGGLVSATANVTGGNVLTGGLVSATANVTGGNLISGGNIFATSAANVQFGDNTWMYTGYTTLNTAGIFHDTGANPDTIQVSTNSRANGIALYTLGLANSSIVSTGGIEFITAATLNANTAPTGGTSQAQITATGLTVTGIASASGNVTGGNVLTGGLISATANVTGGNVLTGGLISATGNVNGGNLVSGANLTITGGNIFSTASAITVNGDSGDVNFAVNGDTTTVFFVDAGTETASFGNATQTTNAIVSFNATNSIKMPVGNTGQRPATGVTGMTRFNSTSNALEIYDNSEWVTVGVPSFTVIADEQFNGDGVNVAFTLSSTQTTNSCIVSINGVVQIPTIAYSVAGTDPTCVLTFTEAPAEGDLIDVREITTTTTVTSISNSSGNAEVSASPTAAQVNVTGDLSVSGTILGGNINSTAITSGTSNMSIVSSGGNIRGNVAGTTVMTISPGLVDIVGNLTVSGNATLSGNILGDRIQNGTTSIDIQTPSGDANISVAGTSNVAVFGPTAVTMAANILPTANVTYDLGSTSQRWKDLWLSNSTIYMGNAQISANATSLIFTNPQGGQTVLAGTTSAITGASVSVTGNVTAGNLVVAGIIVDNTGNLELQSTATNGNVNLTANGTGNVYINANIMPTANAIANIGSATLSFNTIFAKATSAQYADLAEKYTADATYAPGTVVVFGGTHEVTVNATDADRKVAGVVSTNPSYIMNGGLEGANIATVALTGRVPTFVVGPVRKGDMMVSAGLGRARAEADPRVGTVIGKALEDFDGVEGTIEVVVGRY